MTNLLTFVASFIKLELVFLARPSMAVEALHPIGKPARWRERWWGKTRKDRMRDQRNGEKELQLHIKKGGKKDEKTMFIVFGRLVLCWVRHNGR